MERPTLKDVKTALNDMDDTITRQDVRAADAPSRRRRDRRHVDSGRKRPQFQRQIDSPAGKVPSAFAECIEKDRKNLEGLNKFDDDAYAKLETEMVEEHA